MLNTIITKIEMLLLLINKANLSSNNMRITLTDKTKVTKLVTIFRYLKNIVELVNINLTEDKFYVQGLDSSHACLVEVNIDSDSFDSYESENVTLGVSCSILHKVIDCWKEKQEITLECDESVDKLDINFAGEGTLTKSFQLPLMDIDMDLLDVPNCDYQIDMAINSGTFNELVNELAIFNDTVKLVCAEDSTTLSLVAKGDAGTMKASIKDDDIEELAIEEDFNLDMNVGLGYISATCHFHKLNDIVYINCSNERPIKIHYTLDQKEPTESKSYVQFFIATKLDD